MRLLTTTLPRVRKLIEGDNGFTLSVLLVLGALEFLGHRRTATDLHDAFSLAVLGAVVAAVLLRHRHRPLPWLTNFIAWARRNGGKLLDRRFRVEIGLDLRGDPPLPRRMPRGTFPVVAGLLACCDVAVVAWDWMPQGWRVIGSQGFYLGYLLLLAVVWLGLLIAIFAGVAAPMYQLHQWLGPDRETPRRGEWIIGAVYLVVVFAAAWWLTVTPVLILCAAMALLSAGLMVALPRLGPEQFLWRKRPGQQIWVVPPRRLVMAVVLTAVLFVSALLLMACGYAVHGRVEAGAAMAVTDLLGALTAWLTPGLMVAAAIELASWWWHNPARQSKPVVHVLGGHLVPENRSEIRRIGNKRGWGVRWDEPGKGNPSPAVELVEPERSAADEFDPSWPLRVSMADL